MLNTALQSSYSYYWYNGWESFISLVASYPYQFGTDTVTYYVYATIPASIPSKSRIISRIYVKTNSGSAITTNVRLSMNDSYSGGNAGYANNGPPSAGTQRYLSSQVTTTIQPGTTAQVIIDDLVPSTLLSLGSSINQFISIGLSNTSCVYQTYFEIEIKWFQV